MVSSTTVSVHIYPILWVLSISESYEIKSTDSNEIDNMQHSFFFASFHQRNFNSLSIFSRPLNCEQLRFYPLFDTIRVNFFDCSEWEMKWMEQRRFKILSVDVKFCSQLIDFDYCKGKNWLHWFKLIAIFDLITYVIFNVVNLIWFETYIIIYSYEKTNRFLIQLHWIYSVKL